MRQSSAPHRSEQGVPLSTRTAALAASIIQVFQERVAAAVADAYQDLHHLGFDDAHVLALLGLPLEAGHPTDTLAPEAVQANPAV